MLGPWNGPSVSLLETGWRGCLLLSLLTIELRGATSRCSLTIDRLHIAWYTDAV
jgi:hypothetical protein